MDDKPMVEKAYDFSTFKVFAARTTAEMERRRTELELRKKNEKLEELLAELQAMQSELILTEKMAALGKLVAGMAHEINNPVGAISSANQLSRRYIEKMAGYPESADTSAPAENNAGLRKLIGILKDNTEVIDKASARIDSLVKSLRSFASLDEADFQKADIHDGIENTLILLATELQNGITVTRDYEELPQIYCYPSQLNQVYMNILNNALQAVGSSGSIHIRTFRDDDLINVQISDSGRGMSEEQLQTLFDFDFSNSGSRVKLRSGLVTAGSIVKKHKGRMTVDSRVGEGSTFTITLPVDMRDITEIKIPNSK
jgi:signal transduction histidine kinase